MRSVRLQAVSVTPAAITSRVSATGAVGPEMMAARAATMMPLPKSKLLCAFFSTQPNPAR